MGSGSLGSQAMSDSFSLRLAELNGNLATRCRPAPNRDWLVALDDHVRSKDVVDAQALAVAGDTLAGGLEGQDGVLEAHAAVHGRHKPAAVG